MKRTVIFAGFDKDKIIQPYVLDYLEHLKQVADSIVYIADNELSDKEKAKISHTANHIECTHHGEYDFGSYKRGFNYLKEHNLLEDTDEIIFCNDSCFCVDSLKPVFKKMDERDCDIWSMTGSNEYVDHLQSYFFVIRKKVIESEVFSSHLNSVTSCDSFLDIVKNYELPLKRKLEYYGFKTDTFMPFPRKYNQTFFPTQCLEKHDPLIKRKVFTEDYACHESRLKVLFAIKKLNPRAYKTILDYYKVRTFWPLWLKFFIPHVKSFIFRVETSRKGTVKYRFLSIPVFILKTGIISHTADYCGSLGLSFMAKTGILNTFIRSLFLLVILMVRIESIMIFLKLRRI